MPLDTPLSRHARSQKLSAVIVLEAFPRNVAGKILCREIHELYTATQEAT